jgi:hypothetical protein
MVEKVPYVQGYKLESMEALIDWMGEARDSELWDRF